MRATLAALDDNRGWSSVGPVNNKIFRIILIFGFVSIYFFALYMLQLKVRKFSPVNKAVLCIGTKTVREIEIEGQDETRHVY